MNGLPEKAMIKQKDFLYILILLIFGMTSCLSNEQSSSSKIEKSKKSTKQDLPEMEKAIIGGGCFWCIEAALKGLRGVRSLTSGYAGGHVENPTYEQICGKKTGHAEIVDVDYDEEIISHGTLLRVFFLKELRKILLIVLCLNLLNQILKSFGIHYTLTPQQK